MHNEMVDSVQLECNSPFKYIKEISALDPNKVYAVSVKLEDGFPREAVSTLVKAISDAFISHNIETVVVVENGYTVEFMEDNFSKDA